MDCTKTWQCSLIFIYIAILISLEVLILWWRYPIPAISLAGWLLIDDLPDCNKRLPFPVPVPLISSDVLQRVSCCSHCLWHHKAGEKKFQLTLKKKSRCEFRIVFFISLLDGFDGLFVSNSAWAGWWHGQCCQNQFEARVWDWCKIHWLFHHSWNKLPFHPGLLMENFLTNTL